MVRGRFLVPLETAVQVLICAYMSAMAWRCAGTILTGVWIEEEVGTSKTRHMRTIIVPNSVCIEQFSGVISIVALSL